LGRAKRSEKPRDDFGGLLNRDFPGRIPGIPRKPIPPPKPGAPGQPPPGPERGPLENERRGAREHPGRSRSQVNYFYSAGSLPSILPEPWRRGLRLVSTEPLLKLGRLNEPVLSDEVRTKPAGIRKAKRGKAAGPAGPAFGAPPGLSSRLDEHVDYLVHNGWLHFAVRNQRLFRKFNELIGAKHHGRVEAVGKQLGTLYLRTESPHMYERCNYLKRQWISIMNREMGEEAVTDILVRVLQRDDAYPEFAGSVPFREAAEASAPKNCRTLKFPDPEEDY
jgi:hypothetical protein